MQSGVVREATNLNLGIPYNHHAYFAGAVHQRKESLSIEWYTDVIAWCWLEWIQMDPHYSVSRSF